MITSCTKSDEVAPTTNTDPKAGSKWVYVTKTYNEAGAITSTTTQTYIGVEVTVAGSKWISTVDQATSIASSALQKRTDGWWYIPGGSNTSSLWFKYPALVNESYTYVFGTCMVKDINASVVVPAGTFNGCYYVQGHDTNSLEDEFWFTNSGAVLVYFNTYDQRVVGPASNVYKKRSTELVSYTP